MIASWATRHAQVFFHTLGRLRENSLSSLLTVTVIGIALALPAGLHVVVDSTRDLTGSWQGAARISVFLDPAAPAGTAELLASQVANDHQLGPVEVISAEQALLEFRELSGFGDALDALESNPLPSVLVIQPPDSATPGDVEVLVAALSEYPDVDMVQMDAEWLQRLFAILELIQRSIVVIGGLFAVAVIIIVGNTIRLDIQNRREEILVIKLIGGTNAFIRRPFLYTGFWYGTGGALMAWLLVALALFLLSGPVANLAGLYGSDFSLYGLGLTSTGWMFLAGIGLGLAGAWLSVARHLSEIEPK